MDVTAAALAGQGRAGQAVHDMLVAAGRQAGRRPDRMVESKGVSPTATGCVLQAVMFIAYVVKNNMAKARRAARRKRGGLLGKLDNFLYGKQRATSSVASQKSSKR